MPTIPIVPSNYRLRANQVLTAEWFTDQLNGGQAAAVNIIKTAYEFEAPIIAPEFNAEPNVWYLAVPADEDAFDGALGYLEREVFSVTSYSPASEYELGKTKTFEWENYGRNGGFWGLPYRLHRFEADGPLDSYMAALEEYL